jgi:hypothetical protein
MQLHFWTSRIRNTARWMLITASPLVFASNAMAVLGQAWAPESPSAVTKRATLASPAQQSSAQAGMQSATTPTSLTPSAPYSTRVSTTESGSTVTEYAAINGARVFAIAWTGPTMPNLKLLLGDYFQTFSNAAQSSRSQRSLGAPLQISEADLVVRSAGRMRNFSGYAYAPNLIPTGLNIHAVLP